MKSKITSSFQKLIRHELVSGSMYMFVGGMAVNLLNFFFNLFIIRKLSHIDYGSYAAVISLLALLSIPSQAISPTIVRFATEYMAKNELGKAKRFYTQSTKLLFGIGAVIAFVLIFMSSWVSSFFQLRSPLLALSAGVLVITTYISIVNMTYLQSLLQFQYVSLVNFVNGVGKVVIGGILVLLGWQVLGALGGVAVGAILAFILSFLPLRKLLHVKKEVFVGSGVREIGTYGLLASISMFSITSFTSSDILLVKHFFSPSEAGLYAGLSLVGKIIFYFSSPIITVAFPVLLNRFHRKQQMHSVLYLAILLVFLPSLLLAVLYNIYPLVFLTLFLGGKEYVRMSSYVGMYGLYIAVFSVVNVLTTYFLSIQYKRASFVVGIAALCQIIGIALFHGSIRQVIDVLLSVMLGTLSILTYLLIHKTKQV